MSGWNVQPSGIGAVLATVNGHLGDEEGTHGLSGHVTKLGDAIIGAEASAGSEPITMALIGFMEHCLLTPMDSRVTHALRGVLRGPVADGSSRR